MYQIQEVLIPARFICYIMQVLLTIALCFGKEDFILATVDEDSNKHKRVLVRFAILLALFLALELFEFIILLSGYTLFNNLLSVIQIFFHSVAVLILDWFYRDVWKSDDIYIPLLIGGVVPAILELWNLIILCSSNRTIGEIR